jgi:hypothetical protein
VIRVAWENRAEGGRDVVPSGCDSARAGVGIRIAKAFTRWDLLMLEASLEGLAD